MKLKWEFVKAYLQRIRADLKRLYAVLRYLPTLDDKCKAIITLAGTVRIGMPLDPPFNETVVARMKAAGFTVNEPELSEKGYGKYWAVHGHGWWELAAFDFREGSTCKIEIIGEETKTRSVYEVVCNDGASEEVFADV